VRACSLRVVTKLIGVAGALLRTTLAASLYVLAHSCPRQKVQLYVRMLSFVRSDFDWDINWADVGWIREHLDGMRMDEHQRVNHFRNHFELTRKDLLVKNIKRMRKQLEKMDRHAEAERYTFLPISFVLPGDYSLFVEAFRRNPGETWIMKPIGRAQGRGIFLINKLSQISQWKRDHRWRTDTGGHASDRSS